MSAVHGGLQLTLLGLGLGAGLDWSPEVTLSLFIYRTSSPQIGLMAVLSMKALVMNGWCTIILEPLITRNGAQECVR